MTTESWIGLPDKDKKRLLSLAHKHKDKVCAEYYSEQDIQNIVYDLGSKLWALIPEAERVKMGTKAQFLISYLNKYKKK